MIRELGDERRSQLVQEARRVFGSDEKAQHWLSHWSTFLKGVPLEMASTEQECQLAMEELVRIEFGDFT